MATPIDIFEDLDIDISLPTGATTYSTNPISGEVIEDITVTAPRPIRQDWGPPYEPELIKQLRESAEDDEQPASNQEIDKLRKELESLKNQPDAAFDANVEKYKRRLSPYVALTPKMNFFELASDLGAGLLSTPNTGGSSAFTGLGVGFTRASERMRSKQEENRKAMREVGLQAAQLAMQDEQKAQEFLNQIALMNIKNANEVKPHIYLEGVASEESNALLKREDTIGSPSAASLRDNQIYRDTIDALTASGWLVKEDPSSVVNIDQTTETTADKEASKTQYDFQTKVLEESMAASSTRDTIAQARDNARKLTEDGLYPERFGLVPQLTNPIRNFMAGLGLGIVDMDKLAKEDLGNQLGVGFAMATVALTKGAISNREMEMFLQAAPTMGRTYGGYLEMLDYMDRMANRTEEFAEAYMVEKRRIEDAAIESGVKRTASQIKDDLDLFAIRWKKNNSLFDDEEKRSLVERADIENYKKVKAWYEGGSQGPAPTSNAPVVINTTKPDLEAQRNEIIKKLENDEYPDDEIDAAKQLLEQINKQISSL